MVQDIPDMEEGEIVEQGGRVYGYSGGEVYVATAPNAEHLRGYILEGKDANLNKTADLIWVNPPKGAGKPRFSKGGGFARKASGNSDAKLDKLQATLDEVRDLLIQATSPEAE